MSRNTRWIVDGELELVTPLHVGNGLDVEIEAQVDGKAFKRLFADAGQGRDEERAVDGDSNIERYWISDLALDHAGQPYIPGASLKGALKALARRTNLLPELKQLFGWEEGDKTLAGQAEFLCAWCSLQPGSTETVQARNAIDRATGSAQDKKLFRTALIPAGTRFSLRIVVHSASEEEIGHLLGLLEHMASDPSFSLGAQRNHDLGRVQPYGKFRTGYFGREQASAWLDRIGKGEATPWWSHAKEVTLAARQRGKAVEALKIDLQLGFHTPFLVRQQELEADRDAKSDHKPEADAIPRRTANGQIGLPASSLRGRLRSQTERILRTLGSKVPQGHAASAHRKGELHNDLASVLFGSAGWRGIVHASDCVALGEPAVVRQEMVAIDRFTGGGKDGAKFNVDYVECPTLKGSISLDLLRLNAARLTGEQIALWPGLGVITLLLRDLAEGDIAFGYGISKGYGQCRAPQLLDNWRQQLQTLFPEQDEPVSHALQALRQWLGSPAASPLPLHAIKTQADEEFEPRPASTGFHNPYHFIPLVKPDVTSWPDMEQLRADHGHDRYRGLSGRLVCKLTPKTPLFVGGKRGTAAATLSPTPIEPFKLRNEIAIPATSLRGMLSSLFESVSGSNFRVLHPEKYSMRKINRHALSAIGRVVMHQGKPHLLPLTLPTLSRSGTIYPIPAQWGKIFDWDPAPLRVYFDPLGNVSYGCDQPYFMQVAEVDYGGANKDHLLRSGDLRFPKGNNDERFLIGQRNHHQQPISAAELGKLTAAQQSGSIRGWVRSLKAPGRDLPRTVKHHIFIPDLVENPGPDQLLAIPEAVSKRFHDLADLALAAMHIKDGERLADTSLLPYTPVGRPARSGDGKLTRLQHGDLVFFDVDDNVRQPTIKEVSFSSMWRSGIEKDGTLCTTADLLAQYDANLLPYGMAGRSKKLSPTEMLFGFVEERHNDRPEKQADALAGRVFVGFGIGQDIRQDAPVTLKELSTPKPPSPALYFRRIAGDGYVGKNELAKNAAQYTLRGRKAYLHAWREQGQVVALGDNGRRADGNGSPPWKSRYDGCPDDGHKRRVLIEPVSVGGVFHFEIDFNNLSQHQLALLCATLHPCAHFEHRLGMGKPLGLGSVEIDPVGLFLVNRSARYASDDPGTSRYHAAWRAESAAAWPGHLQPELQADVLAGAPQPGELAAEGMLAVSSDVRRALQLLGNPGAIGVPVHYPQLPNGMMEGEHFKWFMANDRDGAPAGARQALVAFTASTPQIKPLIRNA